MPRLHRRFFLPVCYSKEDSIISFHKPWLAPLAGYSDLPFRLLCRESGAAVCETEMISAKGLVWENPGTCDLLMSASYDNPLVVQLFGSEPEIMAKAVLMLRKAGFVYFDCNMGCPVHKVLRQKSGAALLADPECAIEIARAMLMASLTEGPDLPESPAKIGFKLRLPADITALWDIVRGLEDLGASWITLHPRTAAQGYGGMANHEVTKRLTEIISIPVIASGDIINAYTAREIIKESGASTVMYARGALSNPLIFQDHTALSDGKELQKSTHKVLEEMIKRHISLTRQYCGERRAFIKMRSIIPRYVKGVKGVHELRQKLCACESWENLDKSLAEFLEQA